MHGLSRLIEIVGKIKQRINPELEIAGLIITQYSGKKILNKNTADIVSKHFGNKMFKTMIRDNIALAEAPSSGLDIFRYQKSSPGAQDYSDLCSEIIERFQ
jgi:chromosome partitioning protein